MSDNPEPSAATRESGAAVRVPAPPLLFAAPLSATLALQKWLPLPLPGRPVTRTVGAVLTIAGLALSGTGAATFRRNRTTVVPHHPVSTLVTKGPYRISRNPMYTGLAAAYVGAALWVGNVVAAYHRPAPDACHAPLGHCARGGVPQAQVRCRVRALPIRGPALAVRPVGEMESPVRLWARRSAVGMSVHRPPAPSLAAIDMSRPQLGLLGGATIPGIGVALDSRGVGEVPRDDRGQRLPVEGRDVGERGRHKPERRRHRLGAGVD